MSKEQKSETSKLWDSAAEMLGLKGKKFFGGTESCEFSLAILSRLLEIGFINPEQKFNYSPTVGTFYEFGKRASAFGAAVEYIGFLESKGRDTARLVIDGIKVTSIPDSARLIMDFSQTFNDADEFTANPELLRAWYD